MLHSNQIHLLPKYFKFLLLSVCHWGKYCTFSLHTRVLVHYFENWHFTLKLWSLNFACNVTHVHSFSINHSKSTWSGERWAPHRPAACSTCCMLLHQWWSDNITGGRHSARRKFELFLLWMQVFFTCISLHGGAETYMQVKDLETSSNALIISPPKNTNWRVI